MHLSKTSMLVIHNRWLSALSARLPRSCQSYIQSFATAKARFKLHLMQYVCIKVVPLYHYILEFQFRTCKESYEYGAWWYSANIYVYCAFNFFLEPRRRDWCLVIEPGRTPVTGAAKIVCTGLYEPYVFINAQHSFCRQIKKSEYIITKVVSFKNTCPIYIRTHIGLNYYLFEYIH